MGTPLQITLLCPGPVSSNFLQESFTENVGEVRSKSLSFGYNFFLMYYKSACLLISHFLDFFEIFHTRLVEKFAVQGSKKKKNTTKKKYSL